MLRKSQFVGDKELNVKCFVCNKPHAIATAIDSGKHGICWRINSSCIDGVNKSCAKRFEKLLNKNR